jgi:putative solute:sodium symporter small subunit
MSLNDADAKAAYWKENLRLITTLLIIWFIVSYGFGILLVDVLNSIHLFGYKLGFWFAQQGAIYCFVALIFIYTKKMAALDKKYGLEE